jgi:hypothetical protein
MEMRFYTTIYFIADVIKSQKTLGENFPRGNLLPKDFISLTSDHPSDNLWHQKGTAALRMPKVAVNDCPKEEVIRE